MANVRGIHPRLWLYRSTRRRIAARHLAGEGIEVGALHSPFPLPAGVRVRYVDRLTTPQLRAEYPELDGEELVDVDVVDDGERLSTLEPGSQDFVISSHFLEHCEDPIGTLQAQLRVLRPGGVLLLAIPDRRAGIDREREPTPLEHLLRDHEDGPERSRSEHYLEWARLVDLPLGNVAAERVGEHASELERRRYSIHFHCWTSDEFKAQLAEILPAIEPTASVVDERRNQHEFLVVLRAQERSGSLAAAPAQHGQADQA